MTAEPDDFDTINEGWKRFEHDWKRARLSGSEFDGFAKALELRLDWIRMVKTVRAVFGEGMRPAQLRILEHRGWNRFIAHRLKTDPTCQREAWYNSRPLAPEDEPFVVKVGSHYELRVAPKR
jgi:hypothetical protein